MYPSTSTTDPPVTLPHHSHKPFSHLADVGTRLDPAIWFESGQVDGFGHRTSVRLKEARHGGDMPFEFLQRIGIQFHTVEVESAPAG